MNALRVFQHAFLVGRRDFAAQWNWKTWVGGWMLRVITTAAMWVLLGTVLGSQERIQFLLIGNAVFWGVGGPGTVAASTWERYDGTYPLLVASPSHLWPTMMGRTLVWLLNGTATSVAAFAILAVIFGVSLPVPEAIFLPPAIGIVCVSGYCFSLFLGALITRMPKLRNILHNVASNLLMAFCGVSVPVSFWPKSVGTIVQVLPVTHGLASIRLLLGQGSGLAVLHGLALEAAVGFGWLILAILLMDRMANAGRSDGSIDWVAA